MGISWKNIEMPRRIECEESSYTDTYGRFVAEPFERGYGTTIGNALRRILLSGIEGAAVTSIKIDGMQHEFGAISGVVEDVSEIVLNIKRLTLKSFTKNPKTLMIKVEKKGVITGADIVTDETIQVLNPDIHVATLTKNIKFVMELEVGRGRGYVPAERNKKMEQPIGVIAIDSIFTPVRTYPDPSGGKWHCWHFFCSMGLISF